MRTLLLTLLSFIALCGCDEGGQESFPPPVAATATEEAVVAEEPIRVEPPQVGARYGRVEIPRLQLDAPVREGARLRELAKGVGHLPSTYWPGMGGTVALFAHRVTPTLGKSHGPFRYLDRLRLGDRITVVMPYGRYVYRVTEHRVVDASAWKEFRARLGNEQLLIAACHPPGSAASRYVVVAEL